MPAIPPELAQEATLWLDSVDAGLAAATAAGATLEPEVAGRLAAAVGDVQERATRLRLVLGGVEAVGSQVPSRWVPLGPVARSVAERLHEPIIQAAELPDEFIDRAQQLLSGDTRSGFLRHVGDIQAAVFLNLGWGMWSENPDLFPPNWVARDSSANSGTE